MMESHMCGERMRGSRETEIPQPNVRAIRETNTVSQSDWVRLLRNETGRAVKLGARPFRADRRGKSIAEDRGFESEVDNHGITCIRSKLTTNVKRAT